MKSSSLDFLSKKLVKPIHRSLVSSRRVTKLGYHLSQFLPDNELLKGLDVGCGSGELAKILQTLHPQVALDGVDVLVRNDAVINVTEFDGNTLPFPDKSYDFTILVDVLHHTDDPSILMKECVRVSRKFVLIKDHICESWWDRVRLRFMDWVGNRAYNVYLPYNYLSKRAWKKLYQDSQVTCEARIDKLNIYSQPLSLFFDSTLHFMAKLAVPDRTNT